MVKLGCLNTLINMKLIFDTKMGDHVALMKSQFARLAAIGSTLADEIKVTILLLSNSSVIESKPMIASFYSLQDRVTTRNYITVLLIKESKRLRRSEKQ